MRLERIKDKSVFKTPIFQFHKGAIRTKDGVTLAVDKLDFNSIKVRLELILKILLMSTDIFQFHKGAIRTQGRNALFWCSSPISIP